MFKQKADENKSLRGSGCIDFVEEQEADGSVLKALKNGAGITGYHERVAWGVEPSGDSAFSSGSPETSKGLETMALHSRAQDSSVGSGGRGMAGGLSPPWV